MIGTCGSVSGFQVPCFSIVLFLSWASRYTVVALVPLSYAPLRTLYYYSHRFVVATPIFFTLVIVLELVIYMYTYLPSAEARST